MPDIRIYTSNTEDYNFFPTNHDMSLFKIKAPCDAYVALSTEPKVQNPIYEVVFGASSNTILTISKDGTVVSTTPASNLLNEKEYQGFWISWKDGILKVGKEGQLEPLAKYEGMGKMKISYLGFRTSKSTDGHWVLRLKKCGCQTPLQDIKYNQNEGGLNWQVHNKSDGIPKDAASMSEDNKKVFMIRTNFKIPGILKRGSKFGGTFMNNKYYRLKSYEVLAGFKGKWVEVKNKKIPENAFIAGRSSTGELTYVGRSIYEGECYVGAATREIGLQAVHEKKNFTFEDFEVLIQE